MAIYRNLHEALPIELRELLGDGMASGSRAGETVELMHHAVTLRRPWQRFQFHPDRADNPFAKVAETLWLLAGRDDIDWLSRYLPRAPLFSDDGVTWRAAYGPRLRRWPNVQEYTGARVGIDQLGLVYHALAENEETRRAVISLWDPARDWEESKDIPCNNWIHFLIRGSKLHMAVTVRSNDVWWGWSGINTFAFSVIQELLANWLHVEIGDYTTFAGSWHLYEPYWRAARRVVHSPVTASSPYELPSRYTNGAPRIPIDIPFNRLDAELSNFFRVEEQMHNGSLGVDIHSIESNWLRTCAHMLFVWDAMQRSAPHAEIREYLADIPASDYRVAAEQYAARHFQKVGVD